MDVAAGPEGEGEEKSGSSSSVSELEKTSLREAVETFNRTFMSDLWVTIKKGFRNKIEQRNAANLDF
jgi:hypothetical protein